MNEVSIKLADTGSPLQCLESLKLLTGKLTAAPRQFAIKTNELMGLNHLLVCFPERIIFFDSSNEALEYMKLIVELIAISDSHEDFISRVFSRSIADFLSEQETVHRFSRLNLMKEIFKEQGKILQGTLNEFTQWSYLSRPYEVGLLNDTLGKLTADGQRRYESFLIPHIEGHIHFDHSPCRRLLPCWPHHEPVPFSETSGFAKNIYGEWEPNTNTFFYGILWLANPDTFKTVKQNLASGLVSFKSRDLYKDDISNILDTTSQGVLYVSGLPHVNNLNWLHLIEKWKRIYHTSGGSLCILTNQAEFFHIG